MAMPIDFELDDVPASTGFDAIPAGKYKVVIEESEEKPTKANNGSYLNLTFVVVEGPYEGRKVFGRLNLNNPSEKVVQIARSQLKAICVAVGVPRPKDSSELHDLPLIVRVSAKPDDSGELRNDVKGYEAANGQSPAGTARPASTHVAVIAVATGRVLRPAARSGDVDILARSG